MTKINFKFLFIFLIYLSFIFLIVLTFNAVNQDEELMIIEEKKELIKKIENNFTRNENSVYEILENKLKKPLPKNENQSKTDNSVTSDLGSYNGNYLVQFASFKDKRKSDKTSEELTKKFQKLSVNVNLKVKKVILNNDQIFFRVISKSKFTYPTAVNLKNSLKNLNIDCIIVKVQP